MSNGMPQLLLHLPMDQASAEGAYRDISGRDHHSVVSSDVTQQPSLVPDPQLGACLRFEGDGDHLQTPALGGSDAFSISVWVFPEAFSSLKTIFSEDQWTSGAVHVHLSSRQLQVGFLGCAPSDQKFEHQFESNRWQHVAVTYSLAARELALYVDGRPLEKRQYSRAVASRLAAARVGGWAGDAKRHFQGRLAQLRVYDGVQSAEQIQRDIAADLTAKASFHRNHHIDFALSDDDDNAAIYIGDNAVGQQLHLEIYNTADQYLELASPPRLPPDARSAHFELRFAPGTLSRASLGQVLGADGNPLGKMGLATTDGWQMSEPAINPDGTVSLFFAGEGGATIAPADKIRLTLLNVSAAGDDGARSTQVELRYGDSGLVHLNRQALRNRRMTYISVVNHRGKPHLPLHVDFLHGNTVLNDNETANTLTLRLTNVLYPDLDDADRLTIHFNRSNPATALYVTFEIEDDWALGDTDQVGAINIDIDGWTHSKHSNTVWKLTPNADTHLKAGSHLDISFTNIKTAKPAGPTRVYIHYVNIPGYWDGHYTVLIEKSGLRPHHDRIAIGTNVANLITAPLTVYRHEPGSRDLAEMLRLQRNTVDIDSVMEAAGGYLSLHVSDVNMTTATEKARISWRAEVDVTNREDSGRLGFWTTKNGIPKERLTINRDGNVGIGTNDPHGNLEIRAANPVLRLYEPSGSGKAALEFVRGSSTTFGGDQGAADWRIANDLGRLRFEVGGNNEITSRFVLHSNGDVDIGDQAKLRFTTTPPTTRQLHFDIREAEGSGWKQSVLLLQGDPVQGAMIVKGDAPLRLRNQEGRDRVLVRLTGQERNATLHFDLINQNAVGWKQNVLTLNNDGNVGIGTDNPQGDLEIKATNPVLRLYSSSGSGKPALEFVRNSMTFGTDTNADWRIVNNGGALCFERGRNGTTTLVMRMDGGTDRVEIAQDAWENITLESGWNSDTVAPQCFKDSTGVVHFRGGFRIPSTVANKGKGGSIPIDQTAFELAEKFRPDGFMRLPVLCTKKFETSSDLYGTMLLEIKTDGTATLKGRLYPFDNGGHWISLDGTSYRAK